MNVYVAMCGLEMAQQTENNNIKWSSSDSERKASEKCARWEVLLNYIFN